MQICLLSAIRRKSKVSADRRASIGYNKDLKRRNGLVV